MVMSKPTGSPLEMCISQTGERVDSVRVLGTDLGADQRPQVTVPKDAWQTARYISFVAPSLYFFPFFFACFTFSFSLWPRVPRPAHKAIACAHFCFFSPSWR
nr:Cupin [Pandoravirus aubagnensis]